MSVINLLELLSVRKLYVHELVSAAVVHVDVSTVMRAGGGMLRRVARAGAWEFALRVGKLPGFGVVRARTGAGIFGN
jgi:hypothetical protein